MKKLSMLFLSLAAVALLFAACANTDPTKEQDPTSATEAPTEAPTADATEDLTLPAESDDDIIIEPVTLKTEPAEDITEDIGDIDDLTEEENPDIPEDYDGEDKIDEGVIPEDSTELPSE